MAFRVEISPEAFDDLEAISTYIEERATFRIAERWFNEIFSAIRTLAEMPHRCPIAEESAELDAEVRLLLHGRRNRRYKIYFAIHDQLETVRVFHVRHWAMKPIEVDELEDLMDETVDAESGTEESGQE
jgi:plasmid stabilization system protein ParE